MAPLLLMVSNAGGGREGGEVIVQEVHGEGRPHTSIFKRAARAFIRARDAEASKRGLFIVVKTPLAFNRRRMWRSRFAKLHVIAVSLRIADVVKNMINLIPQCL